MIIQLFYCNRQQITFSRIAKRSNWCSPISPPEIIITNFFSNFRSRSTLDSIYLVCLVFLIIAIQFLILILRCYDEKCFIKCAKTITINPFPIIVFKFLVKSKRIFEVLRFPINLTKHNFHIFQTNISIIEWYLLRFSIFTSSSDDQLIFIQK